MKKDSSYHDYILYDLLGDFKNISSKRMLSGWCIYLNEIPVGAIIENNFYLKNMSDKGWKQFEYPKKDKVVKMNYFQVPDELLENREKLVNLIKNL